MKTQTIIEGAAATAATTVATVPVDQLLAPLQNVVIGVLAVLITKAFAWLGRKISGK